MPFTTLQTGLIRGGTAPNIVPRDCEFHFEFRYLPGRRPGRARARDQGLRARRARAGDEARSIPQSGFEFVTKAEIPGLDTAEGDQDHARSPRRCRATATRPRSPTRAEAGLFQQAGIPSIICGPGSIEQAHKPNEFIALDQVARCEAFLERLVEELTK